MNAKDTVKKGYDCFSKGDMETFFNEVIHDDCFSPMCGLILVYQANIHYQECIMANKL